MPLVRDVLRLHPEARDSYKVLYRKVWERCGLYLSDDQWKTLLEDCPPITSVDRAARKIWESNQYLPSKRIQGDRKLLEEQHRKEMVKKTVFVGNTAYIE